MPETFTTSRVMPMGRGLKELERVRLPTGEMTSKDEE